MRRISVGRNVAIAAAYGTHPAAARATNAATACASAGRGTAAEVLLLLAPTRAPQNRATPLAVVRVVIATPYRPTSSRQAAEVIAVGNYRRPSSFRKVNKKGRIPFGSPSIWGLGRNPNVYLRIAQLRTAIRLPLVTRPVKRCFYSITCNNDPVKRKH